jgi:hypothetical protein
LENRAESKVVALIRNESYVDGNDTYLHAVVKSVMKYKPTGNVKQSLHDL